MSVSLRELDVLLMDCQAGGATPAYGDLLEIGWAFCAEQGLSEPIQEHWIQPRTERRITRAVRELTGWSEACIADALPEHEAWSRLVHSLHNRGSLVTTNTNAAAMRWPTLIHYARFELTFLHDLHQRVGDSQEFPLEILCLHAIAARLFPNLPRRNIRALAGFLGHSPDLMRRVHGHVEASAFIWRALIPQLEAQGVLTWSDLTQWLEATPRAARSAKRTYPLALERRRSLPDRPGVYRFVRSNGSVLYVGKATSLKKRIAGHFSSRGPSTERGLELLSQVHDIIATATASVLEAALLETDEIKRLDPPYNVQLRAGERNAWYAARDLLDVQPEADALHNVGPLPSQRALSSFAALCTLASGAEATPALCAMLLAVPTAQLPAADMLRAGFAAFTSELLDPRLTPALRRVTQASLTLFLARGRVEPASVEVEASEPNTWDLARVRRRLERALLSGGLLLRRARLLALLADCDLAYREVGMSCARALALHAGQVAQCIDIDSADVLSLQQLPQRSSLPRSARLQCIDAATYDRLRVLTTELNRVLQEGGELAVRIGKHCYSGARAAGLFAHV